LIVPHNLRGGRVVGPDAHFCCFDIYADWGEALVTSGKARLTMVIGGENTALARAGEGIAAQPRLTGGRISDAMSANSVAVFLR
jgi:hypothetical protein